MVELVLIVEGHGDVESMPHLVGKIGGWLNLPLFTTRPIRSGGWNSLKKANGLEKFVALAASRDGCERVLIIVDLDDDCPVEEANCVAERIEALQSRFGIAIEICFCIREFEAWLLGSLGEFSEDLLKGDDVQALVADAATYRDAKGRLRRALIDGYSESSDQAELVKIIDPASLYSRDRSFRRFVKALSALDYDLLEAA